MSVLHNTKSQTMCKVQLILDKGNYMKSCSSAHFWDESICPNFCYI